MNALARPAVEGDVDAIIQLLDVGFESPWCRDTWRALFEYPMVKRSPNLGFVLESHGEIVGFLGAIYSQRIVSGQVQRFCNMSSWYTRPGFRESSLSLLTAMLAQPGYTITNFTPNRDVVQVIRACGFRRLESHKVLWGPWLYRALVEAKSRPWLRKGVVYKASRVLESAVETGLLKYLEISRRPAPPLVEQQGVVLLAGADLVRPMLSTADRELLDDHPRCGHFLLKAGRSYSYIATVRRKVRFRGRSLVEFVVSDILHLSSCAPALQHWQSLGKFIARHDRSHAIMADLRLGVRQCPYGVIIPDYSYFTSTTGVDASQIDGLYSELALLDQVFYVRSS